MDYPGPESLDLIYGTFNRAMLRLFPHLRSFTDALTHAMIELYTASQERLLVLLLCMLAPRFSRG